MAEMNANKINYMMTEKIGRVSRFQLDSRYHIMSIRLLSHQIIFWVRRISYSVIKLFWMESYFAAWKRIKNVTTSARELWILIAISKCRKKSLAFEDGLILIAADCDDKVRVFVEKRCNRAKIPWRESTNTNARAESFSRKIRNKWRFSVFQWFLRILHKFFWLQFAFLLLKHKRENIECTQPKRNIYSLLLRCSTTYQPDFIHGSAHVNICPAFVLCAYRVYNMLLLFENIFNFECWIIAANTTGMYHKPPHGTLSLFPEYFEFGGPNGKCNGFFLRYVVSLWNDLNRFHSYLIRMSIKWWEKKNIPHCQ